MERTFQVSADIKLRHGKLYGWLQRKGLKVSDLSRMTGISQSQLGDYVNMKDYPKTESTRERLELATGIPFEEMFPIEYIQQVIGDKRRKISRRLVITKEIPFKMLAGINFAESLPSPDKMLVETENAALLKEALSGLNEREQEILKMRYGLDGSEPMTYKQIGNKINLTVERVRQIDKRLLEKTRDSLEELLKVKGGEDPHQLLED